MKKKLVISLLLLCCILLSSVQTVISNDDFSWWNDNWSYRQELHIPIDTNHEQAKHQPIDTHIEFENICWAQSEKEHSIRVIFQDENNHVELESQIYELNYSDNTHVKSCNLVFLIPEEATGDEHYYIYYDDKEKTNPNYSDHVEIEDSYYHYEPIPGYPFESNYYKITEGESIVYAIAQGGKFMGGGIAQQVTKLKPKSTDVLPKSGELFASFDFMYYYGQELDEYSGSVDQLVSKEILLDGNLMVKCRVVSQSSREDVRTSVIYTYYHCPMENKRIYAQVKHEVLDEFTVAIGPEVEGSIASFQCGGLESNSIKDLNFGRIYPYFHAYTEKNTVVEYELDPDPEATAGPGTYADTMVIAAEDDIDLGEKAWISYDEGETGVSHGLILNSNSVVSSGTDERDGVQLKLREQDSTDLPGLENNMVFAQFGRNSYETGAPRDLVVPDDLIVEFDAEFFSTETGGYTAIDQEADFFQSLIKIRPSNIGDTSTSTIDEGTCSLTVFVHNAPSIPFGSSLSIVTGRNLSYISAELYCNDEIYSTGVCGRLSTNPLPSFEDVRLVKKIRLALGIFDWRNLTFLKKIQFQNLKPGTYFVKIFKENPVFGDDQKYIGFKELDVEDDAKTHIFCKPERSVYVSVVDQYNNGVKGADVFLLKNDLVISEDVTNNEGVTILDAPCNVVGGYDLKVLFNGFVVYEEHINLRYVRALIPLKKSVDVNCYDFRLNVVDTWGLSPEYKINVDLTSEEMDEPYLIVGEEASNGWYLFNNLYPAKYQLELSYKSFLLEKTIQIDTQDIEEINIVFPAEFDVTINTFNSRGLPLEDSVITISRSGKQIEKTGEEGFSGFLIPPGTYHTKVYLDDEVIGERKINVMGERTFDFVTTEEPLYPMIITIISVVIALFGVIFAFRKRDIKPFVKILAISLVLIAIVSPWWMLSGSTSQIETSTTMFLIPHELVTITSSSTVLAGEIVSTPEIFSDVMGLLPIALVIACLLILLHMVFTRYDKKRLSFTSILFGIIIIAGSLGIFFYALSQLAQAGIGSFFGEGNIDISIAGEGMRASVFCNWGPSIGFYLCLLSMAVLLTALIFDVKKMLSKGSTNMKDTLSQKNLLKYFKRFTPFIGIIILAYIIVSIGTDEIISTFLKISPLYVVFAALLTLPRILIRNIAWRRIQEVQKIHMSYFKSLKIFLIGYFYGSITPGYLGQLMRIPYMKEETKQPIGKLFVNNFVETIVHTMSLYCMMIIGAFLVLEYVPEALPYACVFVLVTFGIYWYFFKKERGEKTFHVLIRYLIPKKLKPYFMRFVDTFYTDFPNLKTLLVPFLLGIPTWIIIYTQIYILGLSLGIEVPYIVFITLYPIANIIAFIPVTSAGLGTREAAVIFLFSFFGVSPEIAVVLSLSGHLLTDVLTGFYGFILSMTETRDKKKDMSELQHLLDDS